MKEISSQVKEGESLLLSNRFDDFGHLLHEGWKLKKSLGKVITNKKIENTCKKNLILGEVIIFKSEKKPIKKIVNKKR